jgi:hypothetical protein
MILRCCCTNPIEGNLSPPPVDVALAIVKGGVSESTPRILLAVIGGKTSFLVDADEGECDLGRVLASLSSKDGIAADMFTV